MSGFAAEPDPEIPESWPLEWRYWWRGGVGTGPSGSVWEITRVMPDEFDKDTTVRLIEAGVKRRQVIATADRSDPPRSVHAAREAIALALAENNRAFAAAANRPNLSVESLGASSGSGTYQPIANPA